MYGRDFLRKALISSLQRQVEFDRLSYHFPLGIKAENFRIENEIFVKELIVQFNLESLLKRHIILSDVTLYQPLIKITQGFKAKSDFNENGGQSQNSQDIKIKEKPQININKISIIDGKIQYIKSLDHNARHYLFHDVKLTARSVVLPLISQKTTFHVHAFLAGDGQLFSGSGLEGHGWIDFVQKNMQVDVRINQKERNIILLASLISHDNEMLVEGEIKVHNVRLNKSKIKIAQIDSEEIFPMIHKGVDVVSKFSFRTKMDDFQLTQIAFKGSVETP